MVASGRSRRDGRMSLQCWLDQLYSTSGTDAGVHDGAWEGGGSRRRRSSGSAHRRAEASIVAVFTARNQWQGQCGLESQSSETVAFDEGGVARYARSRHTARDQRPLRTITRLYPAIIASAPWLGESTENAGQGCESQVLHASRLHGRVSTLTAGALPREAVPPKRSAICSGGAATR
jgi:hypothetical protein